MDKKTKDFSLEPIYQKVIKPWGYEIILTDEDSPVTSKILHVAKGHRSSLHYHEVKNEILTLLNGQVRLELEGIDGNIKTIEMEKSKGYNIKPGQKHRYGGVEESDILESSTNEEGNTVRVEDDYNRGIETEEERKDRSKKKVYMG